MFMMACCNLVDLEIKMKKTTSVVALCTLSLLAGSGSFLAYAQQDPAPRQPMSFFVTSVGMGHGANLGGVAGADAHCQQLAAAVGAGGKTWHAYLSTQARPGQPAINARDRIGTGPWHNSKGEMIARDLAHLHGDTLELARMGNNITKVSDLTENGAIVPGLTDGANARDREWSYMQEHPESNRHETLTGSTPDGRAFTDNIDHTCGNWTSEAKGNATALRENTGANAQVGMSDRNGGGNGSWNSAHGTSGCSQEDLGRSHGVGLYYCFAIN
jgi:hypothetical protein